MIYEEDIINLVLDYLKDYIDIIVDDKVVEVCIVFNIFNFYIKEDEGEGI